MKERERMYLLKLESMGDRFEQKKKKKKNKDDFVERGSYAERLLQAGIPLSSGTYLAIVFGLSAWISWCALFLGPVLSLFIFFMGAHYMTFGYIEERAFKRKRKVIPHLPGFIDSIASALGTGFNIEGAIIQAAQAVPPGILSTELQRVEAALNRGFSVQEAMSILKQRISGKEITSLAVALGLFSSLGGSMLEPFRRLARKIREQQQVVEKANRDLVQVKQAFSVILLLSLGSPVVLSLLKPDYLSNAFADPLGRFILQFAVILQIISLIAFKKMTSLKI